MVWIHVFQSMPDLGTVVADPSAWSSIVQHGIQQGFDISPADWTVLAQQFETDVFADFRNFANNFVQSGQLWALIIGIVIGYILRGLTSYG